MITRYYTKENIDVGIGATRVIEYVKKTQEYDTPYDYSEILLPGHPEVGKVRIQIVDGNRVVVHNNSNYVAMFRPDITPFLITYVVDEKPVSYTATVSATVTNLSELKDSWVVGVDWVSKLDLTDMMKDRVRNSGLTQEEILNGDESLLKLRLGSSYAVKRIQDAVGRYRSSQEAE